MRIGQPAGGSEHAVAANSGPVVERGICPGQGVGYELARVQNFLGDLDGLAEEGICEI